MFSAFICTSSAGTTYITLGIFCPYYVGCLLAGLGWNSTPIQLLPHDDEQISAKHKYMLLIVMN
jgi:hypothetical protein